LGLENLSASAPITKSDSYIWGVHAWRLTEIELFYYFFSVFGQAPRRSNPYISGYTVVETSFGIYTVSSDILPIQIIDNRQLSAEDNIWLQEYH